MLLGERREARDLPAWLRKVCSTLEKRELLFEMEVIMRNIVVSEFVSLDTVMQAPGGAEEDTEGGFTHVKPEERAMRPTRRRESAELCHTHTSC